MNIEPHNASSVEAIAARLKIARNVYGLTQVEFCRRADIPTNTYNQYEKAVQRPSLDFAMKLCDTYGLTLDWIYLGNSAGLPLQLAQNLQARAS